MGKFNNIGTYTLSSSGGPSGNGVYTVSYVDGVTVMAFKLSTGGAATISGNATIGDFGASTDITLIEDEPTIVSCPTNIDGLIITVTSGMVTVITNQ